MMERNNEELSLAYNKKVHTLGRITSAMLLIMMIGIPVLFMVILKLEIEWGPIMTASLAVLSFMAPATVVEFLSYAPILGAGGQYLAFITGNIMNMKLPAAVSSIKLAGYEEGTEEADAISTVAIGISSLVTMAVLIVGLIIGAALLPFLQHPVLAPAFDNLMPAILGALVFPVIAKNVKGAVGPVVVGVVLILAMGKAWFSKMNTILIPVFIVVAIIWSYLLYKVEQKKVNG